MKRAYKYLKKELLSDNNVWNTLSILVSLIIFSPILLIILNITEESNNWFHIAVVFDREKHIASQASGGVSPAKAATRLYLDGKELL